jgi:iron complex outermembrane receptor protein
MLFAILLPSSFIWAQGTVQGTVQEQSGAAVPAARVLLEQGLVQREAVSDPQGRFQFDNVAAGDARLTVVRSGFTQSRQRLSVRDGVNPELTLKLEIAPVSESVTVVAEGDTYRPESATAGTKLDLLLFETPQAVSVITRRVVEDRQVLRLAELADNVAGVRSSPGYGGLSSANYYIRGFRGSFTGGNLRDGFRDYTFISAREVQGVERTEFLKGPASIVYGQQEVGGIVNTVLKRPNPKRAFQMGMQTGSFGLARPTIDLNTPLNRSESVLFRLNGAYEYSKSHRDFVRSESQYLSPALVWRLRPQTSVRFQVEMQRYRYLFDLGYFPEPEFFAQPVNQYYGEPGFNFTDTRQATATVEISHAFSDSWNLRSAVNGLVAEGKPRYINPASLQADRRTINRSAFQTDEMSQNYSWQNEVYGRFKTGPFQHNLVAGAELVRWEFRYVFLFGSAAAIDRINPVYGRIPSSFSPLFGDKTYANISGNYFQDQITLRRNLKLLVGGRADFVDQRSKDPLTGLRTNSRSTFNFAPRFGLLYNPLQSTAIYFSYTNSFLPQYGVSRTGERFDPQRGKQWELGAKQNFLGERLFGTLTLYSLERSNVPTTDTLDPRFSILTGKQRSKGLEAELTGRITRQWNVIGNYSAIDAFVSEDNRLRVGSKLVGVPKNSMGLWSTYDIDRGRLSGLGFGGGVFAASQRQARLPNVATWIPSYGRVDVYLAYRMRHWKLQLNIKNLNDVKWYEAQGSNVFPQATRRAIVSASYLF